MTQESLRFGLEEEVFLIEDKNPSLQSFFYLAKLMKKDPSFYYFHSASNFSRGRDILKCFMSGVEISTKAVSNPQELIEDLKKRRGDLIEVSDNECLIIPLGSLIHLDAPTLTCALQIHLSGLSEVDKVYWNLAYFLPLLTLLTINSPGRGGSYFGQSYRIFHSFAIGPISDNPWHRFQDIIISRRLKTIEIRVFDPCWDLEKIEILLKIISALVQIEERLPFEKTSYRLRREKVALYGYCKEIEPLYRKLASIFPIERSCFTRTPADEVWHFYEKYGLETTYATLDNAYRNGQFKKVPPKHFKTSVWRKIVGFSGYYLPKIPYNLWKFGREHGYI
jgi:hypothetical protein